MVTIFIPTLNRPNFIKRALAYYASAKCTFKIAIGDSSEPQLATENQRIIATYKSQLDISYIHCPQLNDSQTIKALAEKATTPYVVFTADDDLLIVGGLQACIDFLERNSDYEAAHGQGLVFAMHEDGPYGTWKESSLYRQPEFNQPHAQDRFLAHLGHYTVSLFSVHRTKTWQSMYKHIDEITDKSFTEILPCCLTAVSGKVKALKDFYLVRQSHARRYTLPGVFDWMMSAQWRPSYLVFERVVAQALVDQTGMTTEQAIASVKQGFWSYMTRLVTTKAQPRKMLWQRAIGRSRYLIWDVPLWKLNNPLDIYYKDMEVVRRIMSSKENT